VAAVSDKDARQVFFEAALEVVAEKGYAATRMDDIVRRAGRSKGGLYHHFRSKRDLFMQLFDSLLDDMREELARGLRPEASPVETMRHTFQMFTGMLENGRLGRALVEFFVVSLGDQEVRVQLAARYAEIVELQRALIVVGMERGELRADLDAERVAWAFSAAGDGLVFVLLSIGQEARVGQALTDYFELILRSISA